MDTEDSFDTSDEFFDSTPMPPSPPLRQDWPPMGVLVGGEPVCMATVQAILESLDAERPDLFGFLRALPADDSMTAEERVDLMRHFIREDYSNYAAGLGEAPEPPTGKRSFSMQQAFELAQRLDAEEQEKRTVFYCSICMMETPIHGSFTLDCSHRFCPECLQGYVTSKINSNEVSLDQLICPIPECIRPIHHTTVRGCTLEMGDAATFEKFDKFATEGFIEKQIQTGGYTRCPTETCNFVFQWSPDGSSLHFDCPSCSSAYCLNCALVAGGVGPGHEPYTCSEQAVRNEQIAEEKRKFDEWKVLNARSTELFEATIRSNGWKKCPNCSAVIDRTEGCDHMTCKVCKCAFCYICGKYDAANPTSRGDCGTTCKNRNRASRAEVETATASEAAPVPFSIFGSWFPGRS